jgi:hypothetical protein
MGRGGGRAECAQLGPHAHTRPHPPSTLAPPLLPPPIHPCVPSALAVAVCRNCTGHEPGLASVKKGGLRSSSAAAAARGGLRSPAGRASTAPLPRHAQPCATPVWGARACPGPVVGGVAAPRTSTSAGPDTSSGDAPRPTSPAELCSLRAPAAPPPAATAAIVPCACDAGDGGSRLLARAEARSRLRPGRRGKPAGRTPYRFIRRRCAASRSLRRAVTVATSRALLAVAAAPTTAVAMPADLAQRGCPPTGLLAVRETVTLA